MKYIFIPFLLIYLTNCAAQTEDNNLEEELIKVKNQAFCDCYYESTKKEPIKYKDGSTYFQVLDLSMEYVYKNEEYKKMIHNWGEKKYKSYNPDNNLYLMKCLDFYNSEELAKFVDSIRQKEIKLRNK